MKQASGYKEAEIESWFCKESNLPGGERVLVINGERPLRRMPDIIGIDAEGGIVIIEVKNEKSTRSAIGQSLEYLSQYHDVTIEELAEQFDEYTGRSSPTHTLNTAFQEFFGKDLCLSERRRVYVVAPEFDIASGVCAQYLSHQLRQNNIEFHLARASREGKGFRFEAYDPPIIEFTSKLKEGFAVSAFGRIFYVLSPGPAPVLWNVGKKTQDQSLRLPSGRALGKRLVRVLKRKLIPLKPDQHPKQVDLSLTGQCWKRSGKPERTAKILGTVALGKEDTDGGRYVLMAQFKQEKLAKFMKRRLDRFKSDWEPSSIVLPDWGKIAEEARAFDQEPDGAGGSSVVRESK